MTNNKKTNTVLYGVGIHVFCDRDIKRILNNQEYPATRMNLSSILINKWIG